MRRPTFVATTDVMVGGTHVPAGSYTIFAIPNKDKWMLVISKKPANGGTVTRARRKIWREST